uniref:Uncharacterized protein n=1 Tax=Nelumbo nucifera TaxID=4432 RepID=A0A822XFK9_NELNU|nr:TPA_asm: hypothetical protein HUJ06_019269 [Nelumbo nucifera]
MNLKHASPGHADMLIESYHDEEYCGGRPGCKFFSKCLHYTRNVSKSH